MNFKFCENCSNLMDFCLQEDGSPIHICSRCSHIEEIKDKQSISININKELKLEEILNTNKYLSLDPTIPTIKNKNIKCINKECETNKTMNSSINYIKYDEEELKFLYVCNICGHKWTNDIK